VAFYIDKFKPKGLQVISSSLDFLVDWIIIANCVLQV